MENNLQNQISNVPALSFCDMGNVCLENPRHERFALALACGQSRTQAYKIAGYRGGQSAASRLSSNVIILARVNELKALAARRAELTLDNIIDELEFTRKISFASGHCGAAVMASIGKAKLLGLGVTKE